MRRAAVVSCGKRKLTRSAMAKDMYIGPYFKACMAYAISVADIVLIFSAKYGLIRPTDVIAPYDVYLPNASTEYQKKIKAFVSTQLEKFTDAGYEIIYVCGKTYWSGLPSGATPLDGVGGLGRQMKWMKAHRGRLS